jgi:LysR family transcriptional regulator of gallate degradation
VANSIFAKDISFYYNMHMETITSNLNLRHLSVFLAVCKNGSISKAAETAHLSQPAITHAIKGLEGHLQGNLFHRTSRGMTQTALGEAFRFRVNRAFERLNTRLPKTSSPSKLPIHKIETRATSAQLKTLLAIKEAESYSAAARGLGLAQPTVYRAAKDLEARLGVTIFETSTSAVRLTPHGEALQQNARLMFAELQQGLQEIATQMGRSAASIRIGALPLVRATILAPAVNRASDASAPLRAYVDDGPYSDLLQSVRAGALDILVGALRNPTPPIGMRQEHLFLDRLGIFCGPGHPLLNTTQNAAEHLHCFAWVLPRSGTPTRIYFEAAFPALVEEISETLVETSSMVLMRELLQSRDRLTLISRAQVVSEVRQAQLFELPIPLNDPPRPIGFLCRADWHPTEGQKQFLQVLREVSQTI